MLRKTPLLAVAVLLAACSREVSVTAGPATPVTPSGEPTPVATATPTPGETVVPSDTVTPTPPTETPTTPTATPSETVTASPETPTVSPTATTPSVTPSPTATPSATPTPGPLALSPAGVGPFTYGKRFTPSADVKPVWNPACGAWQYPDQKAPSVLGIPMEGSQRGEVNSMILLAPGATGPSGVAIGSPFSQVRARERTATLLPGSTSTSWVVVTGAVRTLYVSWDKGRTVGSIELQDNRQPLEAPVVPNPCR